MNKNYIKSIVLASVSSILFTGCIEDTAISAPTTDPTPDPTNNINLCPSYDGELINTEGQDNLDFEVGPIIALCEGWVLVTNQTSNTIQKRNVYSGELEASYQLGSKPYEFVVDASLSSVFVSHGPVSYISRVSLSSGNVDTIIIDSGAQSVASDNNGKVFVKRNSGSTVDVIDGSTMSVLASQSGIAGSYIYYNEATERLITSTNNYFFNTETDSFTLQGSSNGGGSGSDCDRVIVSPDGDHAVKPCGAGNGAGYSVYDFYSHDPSIVLGIWDTGAYPSGAAFGPSNNYVLLTNRTDIQLFDVDTHQLVTSYVEPYCSYSDTRRLAVSLDGQSLYSVTQCGFDNESGIIKWSLYDTTQ